MLDELCIEPMQPGDWEQVSRIYAEGIATGNATFEQSVPPYGEWESAHMPGFSLVARRDGEVVGWAALSPTSRRHVYRGVAEISLYVGEKSRSRGVGSALMATLIELSEAREIWTLQSVTFPENSASMALQRKFGFREVGRRERLGKMDGHWRDVVLLERRSRTAGVE